MWKMFGIDEMSSYCTHPCNFSNMDDEVEENTDITKPERQLWFVYYFSHLMKNLWTSLTAAKTLWTPDGIVKLEHYQSIMDWDGGKQHLGLKLAHKLSADHLQPKIYQKMNDGLRFFFTKCRCCHDNL